MSFFSPMPAYSLFPMLWAIRDFCQYRKNDLTFYSKKRLELQPHSVCWLRTCMKTPPTTTLFQTHKLVWMLEPLQNIFVPQLHFHWLWKIAVHFCGKRFFFLKHWYLFSHILETFFSSQAFVHPRFGGPKHWRESDHVAFILKIIPNMSSA